MAASRTLMVVVLYRGEGFDSVRETQTVRCVESAMLADAELAARYDLLIWDNSPKPARESALAVRSQYEQAHVNDGVSGAYNAALDISIQHGCEWMMLLDQDTDVTTGYLRDMLTAQQKVCCDRQVGAIAPLLFEGAFQLSPTEWREYGSRAVAPEPARVLNQDAFAANSGVMMRVDALQQVGGYSRHFWLDYSDIELFHRLYEAGKRIYLASSVRLEHSMTMLDYDGRMTPGRYSNFLNAEQAFGDLYRTPLQNVVQAARLLARGVKQRRFRNKVYSRMTWRFLLWRLLTPKARRLETWHARRAERLA